MALLPNNDEPDYQILISVIDGTSTPEEAAVIEAWLNASPVNRELYFRIKDILDKQRAANMDVDTAAGWEEVTRQLERRSRLKKLRWWRYAAMIAIMALAGGSILFFGSRKLKPVLQMTVAKDEKTGTRTLPDGSRIWLRSGSTLSYRRSFGKSEREVWITGTAFFEVQPAIKPFTVHTGKVDIAVLGTSFTVHERDGLSAVIVNTGKVKAIAGMSEMLLLPDERVVLGAKGLEKSRVNAALYAAWKDGDYQFNNTSLEELKDMISSNYGLTVKVIRPESFSGTSISGHMIIEDEAALKNVLSGMLNASVDKTGNILTIQPKSLK